MCGLRRFKKPTGQEPRAARCGTSGKRGDAPCRLLQPALLGCLSAGISGVGRLNRMPRYAFRRPTLYLPRRKSNAGRMECEKCGLAPDAANGRGRMLNRDSLIEGRALCGTRAERRPQAPGERQG